MSRKQPNPPPGSARPPPPPNPPAPGWRRQYTGYVAYLLGGLRVHRDAEKDPEIRHAFNDACDRLDVLLSKLVQREKEKP